MGDEPRGLLQFRMLGPLEAWRGDTLLRLGGERQRALLALLLVHANELVRTEQLVDQLLGGEVSDSALNTTRVAVSRLRRLLEDGGGAGVLVTRAGGYVLNAGPEQLDVARFERLLADGRGLLAGGDAASAAARLREALALWRGPPLADLALLEFVQPEIRRLEELRLLALMERIDADLALGADADLIGELEGLVASNPLKERLRAQLMLALYRAGRQAEALEVYRQTSELLRGELGLEPSRGLQELERQVLSQDPALEPAAGPIRTAASATEERAVCPYKGLASFDRSDAEYFCGRERIVSDLVARLAESTLVGIVGPSGIGKSSLLRAGLLSALGAGVLPGSASWRQVLVRPGERPCEELARALGGEEPDVVLAALKPGDRMVVAVDQLEELFTVCEREGERVALLDQLASAACDTDRRVLIVVALRADFYGRCASYTRFAQLLSSSHVLVGPMSREELARAIELPADRAGLEVEPALVEDLVTDVAGEPGGLPLLSTMLLELWRVRDGRVLRAERYAASGGVRGAVARLAENAYQRLDEPGRRVARGLLLRLVHGEDGALVRRRLPRAELEQIDGAEPVLAALTDARLLTASDGEVEISHEALLTQWPRYRAWLEEDRVGRRLHAHLTDISREWDAGGRDPGDLYRGARLTAALDWSAQHQDELSPVEQEFIEASRGAAGRATRRLRAVLAGVAVLLVISLIAGVLALAQKHHATTEARAALARQIGAEAVNEPRLDLAMLLAREAVSLDRSPQTEATLLATLQRSPTVIGTFALPINFPPQLALSPDGHTLAVSESQTDLVESFDQASGGGDVRFYDPRTHALQRPPLSDFYGVEPPVYSSDGSLLVYPSVTGAPSVVVRNAHTLALLAKLTFDPFQIAQLTLDIAHARILISPDRRTVYCAYQGFDLNKYVVEPSPGATYLVRWSLPSGRRLSTTRIDAGNVLSVRLVDAGAQLVVVDARRVSVFDTSSLRRVRSVAITPAPTAPSAAAISPNGRTIAVGSPDGQMSFVDSSTGHARRGVGSSGHPVTNVVYGPDGRSVVSTGNDNDVIVWNPQAARIAQVLTVPAEQVEDVAFSSDASTLYVSSVDSVLFEWDLTGRRSFGRRFALGAGSPCCGAVAPLAPPLALSPDGTRFAVRLGRSTVGLFSALTLRQQASFTIRPKGTVITALAWSPARPELAVGGYAGHMQLWRVAGAPRLVRSLTGLPPIDGLPEAIQALAFSSDGRLLAASDSSESVQSPGVGVVSRYGNRLSLLAIWRASNGTLLAPPQDLGIGSARYVGALAFSPDRTLLAVSAPDDDGHGNASVLMLDTATHRTRRALNPLGGGDDGTVSLAFAPDGVLATGTAGGILQLWNPTSGQQLAGPLAVTAGPVTSIAFDSTGELIATTGQDGTAKLWFTSSLQQEGTEFRTDPGAPASAAFSADSRDLLVVDNQGSAFTWPASLADWEQRACAIAGRSLTRAEWSRYLTGSSYAQVCP